MQTEKVAYCEEAFYHAFCREGSTMHNHNSRKNLDILKVMDQIVDFAKEHSLYEKYAYDLEYMYIEHILITSINRVAQQNNPEKGKIIREMLLFYFAVCCLAYLFLRLGTRPFLMRIHKLDSTMEAVDQGILKPVAILEYQDELGKLTVRYNKMVQQIQCLMQEQYVLGKAKSEAELYALQTQISPHFLYNTLDTIVWLIEGGMTDDAVEMISSLSIFFRTSLSKGNDIIPLSEEKRHTLSYLEIQQFRYRDILEFELSIPKELDGIQVPKLSIQPLAENALYHGIKNRRGKGKITITGREEADAIVLTVSDNGQGMTPERLHEVQEAIRTGERAGFGLAAVAERIALYYGPGYGMTISSKEGVGTTVEIRLGKNIQPKS